MITRYILCGNMADAELLMNKYLYLLSQRKDVPAEKDIKKTDRRLKEIIFNGDTRCIFTTSDKYYNGNYVRRHDDHTLSYDKFNHDIQTYVDYPNIYFGPPD